MEASDRAESVDVLSAWVRDARRRTLDLTDDLDDEQLIGPKLPTVNPLLWEMGHAAWFQEYWVLQHACGGKPMRPDSHTFFDSIGIAHDVRWDLPLPNRDATIRYICDVRDNVLDALSQRPLTKQLIYFVKLSVFHEDMHTEAFTYTRQTHGYPQPALPGVAPDSPAAPAQPCRNDVAFAGGTLRLGAARAAPGAFDNEQWEHAVTVAPFAMARTAVTQGELAEFVEDGGYRRREFWCDDGWEWREQTQAEHPVFWKRGSNGNWLRRHFDRWLRLEPHLAANHVNWFEAGAFCRWAGRRLPTESEWELAAKGLGGRSHYPWGEEAPADEQANLDWQAMGPVDVAAHPAGDSDAGCRQMIGNVWEWTASTFGPYPGFQPGPYTEYSRPCFGECKVLRGGCWATRSRMIRNTWRNYYTPDRRDVFAGFRTCPRANHE
ncbi:MAG: selenoneine synthase SenA [Planctomycetaceae bacterium]